MSETIDYEEMKAELGANGYSFDTTEDETYDFMLWAVYTPSSKWECHYPSEKYKEMDDECKSHLVEKAWAHYQREKKYTAMEAALCSMIDGELYMDTDSDCHPSIQLLGWIRRVEEILK